MAVDQAHPLHPNAGYDAVRRRTPMRHVVGPLVLVVLVVG